MKTHTLVKSAVFIALSTYASTSVFAAETPDEAEQAAPKIYGQLNINHEQLNNGKDDGVRVGRASIGVKGPLEYGSVKLNYNIEAELSDIANADTASDNKEARIRTAMISAPTKAGTFLAGTGYSGQRGDLYGHLDIFDHVETYNPTTGGYGMSNSLTAQTPYTPGVIAYKTPVFGNTYVVGALASVRDDNGDSTDASLIRAVYKKDNLMFGAGITNTDKSILTATSTEDYIRTALAASYTADKWQIGATHEDNKDHPSGDFTVLGVAGSYKVTPKAAIKLGYFDKNHDRATLDNTAIISNVSYTIGNSPKQGKSAKVYLENESHDISANDKTTLGIALKF